MCAKRCQAQQQEEISCDKYRRKMTASTACEQIDLERIGVRGIEKMKVRESKRQVVSGTIQLPSDLYWISPAFKIKRQISLDPRLDPTGRIPLFFQTAQEPEPLPPPFQRALYITPSTVESYYLYLHKVNLHKGYYVFLLPFYTISTWRVSVHVL